MKILNLYSGIGGNRKLWDEVRDDLEITAVENVPEIAKIYQDFFPKDEVIVADAHQYLLEHFKEYDFIWSSPPCPTHSVCNHFLQAQGNVRYPDMSLWQEIVFLEKWFKGKWVVENVKSYYPPLWPPKVLDRHYFWSNFPIKPIKVKREFNIVNARASTRQNCKEDIKNLEDYHGIYLRNKKTGENYQNKRLLLRNCVYPPIGKHILEEAFREYKTLL